MLGSKRKFTKKAKKAITRKLIVVKVNRSIVPELNRFFYRIFQKSRQAGKKSFQCIGDNSYGQTAQKETHDLSDKLNTRFPKKF